MATGMQGRFTSPLLPAATVLLLVRAALAQPDALLETDGKKLLTELRNLKLRDTALGRQATALNAEAAALKELKEELDQQAAGIERDSQILTRDKTALDNQERRLHQ